MKQVLKLARQNRHFRKALLEELSTLKRTSGRGLPALFSRFITPYERVIRSNGGIVFTDDLGRGVISIELPTGDDFVIRLQRQPYVGGFQVEYLLDKDGSEKVLDSLSLEDLDQQDSMIRRFLNEAFHAFSEYSE